MDNQQNCCCDHHDHHHGHHGHHPSGRLVGKLKNPAYYGLSSYQIWLNNGHIGSEEDYLADISGDGISKIELTDVDGLTKTYTIFLDKGDQYQISLNDGSPGANGVGIRTIDSVQTDTAVTITVTLTNDAQYSFDVPLPSDGRNPVLRASNGIIQWKYENEEDSSYQDLVDLTELISIQVAEQLPTIVEESIGDTVGEIVSEAIDEQMSAYSFIEFVDELPQDPNPSKIYILREEVNN